MIQDLMTPQERSVTPVKTKCGACLKTQKEVRWLMAVSQLGVLVAIGGGCWSCYTCWQLCWREVYHAFETFCAAYRSNKQAKAAIDSTRQFLPDVLSPMKNFDSGDVRVVQRTGYRAFTSSDLTKSTDFAGKVGICGMTPGMAGEKCTQVTSAVRGSKLTGVLTHGSIQPTAANKSAKNAGSDGEEDTCDPTAASSSDPPVPETQPVKVEIVHEYFLEKSFTRSVRRPF